MTVVFNTETLGAFRHLPGILLAGMPSFPLGILVARGDLAVEAGWNRLSKLREGILVFHFLPLLPGKRLDTAQGDTRGNHTCDQEHRESNPARSPGYGIQESPDTPEDQY